MSIIVEYFFFRQKTSMLSFLKAVREMSWVLMTQMMKCLRASYVWKNAIG